MRWLDFAKQLPMHELERQVVAKVGGKRLVTDRPAETHWRTPETVELRMHLPAATWALVKRAMEGARQAAEHSLSDAEALEAVALEALSRLCDPDSTSIADPRKAVVLYRCRQCEETELETTAGAVPLPPTQAERLSSGAKRVDLETEGWGDIDGEPRLEGDPEAVTGSGDVETPATRVHSESNVGGGIPAAVRRAVLARDRGRCRVCGKRRYVDVHHLKARSNGGAHTRTNCLVVCTRCHAALHEGQLRLEGDAEGDLRLERVQEGTFRVENEAAQPQGCTQDDSAASPELDTSAGTTRAASPLKGDAMSLGSSAEAKRVLTVMGARGGWCADELMAATGLKVSEVSVALYHLRLAQRIRGDWFGRYIRIDRCSGPEAPLQAQLVNHEHAPVGASRRVPPSGAHEHAPIGASVELGQTRPCP